MGRIFDIDAWACYATRAVPSATRHDAPPACSWKGPPACGIYCVDCRPDPAPADAGRPEIGDECAGCGCLFGDECAGCGCLFVDHRVERSHVYGQGDHALLDAAIRAAWASGWRGGPHQDVDRFMEPIPASEHTPLWPGHAPTFTHRVRSHR